MKTIELNGQAGGGQMLRTALSLAMITGQPFRMRQIRGASPKPGLMRQHLTCVQAATTISHGAVDGACIGSTEIIFHPGEVSGGDYQFAIGNAGSVGLLYQTLLPALLHASTPSTLLLRGGTHNPLAPPYDFLNCVLRPALEHFSVNTSLTLLETGFAPVGGGQIKAHITPSGGFDPCEWHERGLHEETHLYLIERGVPSHIIERLRLAAEYELPDAIYHHISLTTGEGSFSTMHLSDHVPTNISVIEKFLPLKFKITDGGKKQVIQVRSS